MKRFTETEKWRDAWFRKLTPVQKCLWQYLCDNCDSAGVIDLDIDLASFQIGARISERDTVALAKGIATLPSGKLWVRAFVRFQFGQLSDACGPHKQVFAALQKHSIDVSACYDNSSTTLPLPLPKGTVTLQDKDKDKDKVQDKDTPPAIELPLGFTEEFAKAWADYVDYRRAGKMRKLQPASIRAQFAEFSEWGEALSIEAIRKTITKGWQGIFHPNKDNAGKTNAPHQPNSRSFAQRQSYGDLGL